MTLQAFVNKYGKYALSAKKDGIYPSVSLAVAYLESNKPGGVSLLAEKYNNFHGIQVYPKFKGQTIKLTDAQKGDIRTFCRFPDPQSGFDGFTKFLKANPRYAKAGVFTATTPGEQIKRIASAGYSETGTWELMVNRINPLIPTIPGGDTLLVILILGISMALFAFMGRK